MTADSSSVTWTDLTVWDHVVLASMTYSFIAMCITGWIFWFPADANWRAWLAIAAGHAYGLGGLLWAKSRTTTS